MLLFATATCSELPTHGFLRPVRRPTFGLTLPKFWVVCTDQFGTTQPAAVEEALRSHVQIRNFAGTVVYHPKVYLAHDVRGRPVRFLVSSANLSSAAFSNSIEAGILGEDPGGLRTLSTWFDDLFQRHSAEFTPETLRRMEENWRSAAAQRARARLRVRRSQVVPPRAALVGLEAEDVDALEDVFATVQVPIGMLNMDYAGNNIRNVRRVREVLAEWDTIRTSTRAAAGKQRSELKLLGFAEGPRLTALGRAAAAAGSEEEVARLWCAWLQHADDAQLLATNSRLQLAKRVFPQFWRLQDEVRDYFLANAENPSDRRTLKTIELLCNGSDVVQALSLDDVRTLTPLFGQLRRLPEFIRAAIRDYKDNKGMRGWEFPDRRIVPQAWREAAGAP